jgi:hypothetical protein
MSEERSSEFSRKAEDFKKSMEEIIQSGGGRAVVIILLEDGEDDTYRATVSGCATDRDLAMCVHALFENEKIKEMIIEEAKLIETK